MSDALLPREVRAVIEIASALMASSGARAVMDSLLERTVHELGYSAAALRLRDDERDGFTLRAAYGLPDATSRIPRTIQASRGSEQALLSGSLREAGDTWSAVQISQEDLPSGLESGIRVPLVAHDVAMGVLEVYTARTQRFSAEEQALLSAVARIGARAICRVQRADAYHAIAQQLMEHLDLQAVLTTLLSQLMRALHVPAGSLRLLDPQRRTLLLAAASGLSEAYIQKGVVEVARSPLDQHVIRGGTPIALTEVSRAAGLQYPEEAQREGIRALVAVPLRLPGLVIGVLRLYSRETRRFIEAEIALAAASADLGALAIENARLRADLQARLDAASDDASGWYRYLAMG